MAEKRVIEIEVKTDKANKAINDLTKSNTDLAASFEDVYGEMQPLSGRMGELEDRLYELALAGKQNTQEYKDLQAEIAKFKKVIAETDASVDGAAGTMSQKLGGALGGITSAFELGQGAMMSFGVSSQEVEEALLKVQSAMAISQGFQGIKDAIPSFKSLGTTATNAFQNMTAAGKVFAITGIGLLITGLSLVITYWDDIRKAVGGVSEEEQKLAEYRRQYAAEQDKQVAEESKGFATLIAQLKASNKGSKERSELISEINKKYGTTLKNLSDEAEFQNQLNQELANYLTYQQAKFRLQKNEEAIVRNLETQSKLKRDLVQAEKDLAKAIQDGAGKTRTTLEEGVAVQIAVNQEASNAAERASERIKKNTKELADAEDRFENYGKAAIYASGQIDKLTYSGKKYVEQNTEVKTSTEKSTKEITKQADTVRDTNQEMLDAGDTFAEAAKKRRDKTEQEIKDSEQAKNDASRYWQNLDLDFTLKNEEEKQLARQKTVDLALKTAQTFAQVYGELNNLLNASDNERLKSVKKGSKEEEAIKKRMFERDKKLRIVQTIIDTASNVVTSVRNGGGIPTGIPFGVAAGVMGALQIAAISKTKFEGSSGGGGGDTTVPQIAGAGGTVITPNFNIVGNAQATNPLAGLGEGLIQAYVVSGDVTTAQSLDRNRVNNATFG
jgi:hypothetical protein